MRSKYRHFVGCTRSKAGLDAVVTDACDEQSYAMFDAMRGTATARPGIQSPLY
jgi:hypothetical protein